MTLLNLKIIKKTQKFLKILYNKIRYFDCFAVITHIILTPNSAIDLSCHKALYNLGEANGRTNTKGDARRINP